MHDSLTLALHRVRDTRILSDALGALFTFQTAHLVPAAYFLRPGFATLLRSPESRGGRSEERRSGARRNTRGRALCASQDARERAYDAARQALARRLASHDAGRSPLAAPPWRFFPRGLASASGQTR